MMSVSRRRFLGSVAVGAIVPDLAYAQDAGPVQEPIRMLYAGLQGVMRDGRATPFPQRFDTLAPVIEKVFDLATVLRVSVGPRWATLDDAAHQALAKAFRNFTVATYVANFDSDEGEKFEVLPGLRNASNNQQIVSSRIVPAKGDPVRLDYVMHNADGWRIVDVLLDGTISRVAVQRSDFRSLLAQGDADALIASLQRKTSDLSGGSLRS